VLQLSQTQPFRQNRLNKLQDTNWPVDPARGVEMDVSRALLNGRSGLS